MYTPDFKAVSAVVIAHLFCVIACATDYYIDSDAGSDDNTGTASDQAWASLEKASSGSYAAGDKILLQRGDSFAGKLFLDDVTGAEGNPIEIGAYGEGEKPYIDAAGYLAAVHLRNSHFVDVRDLKISADGGVTVDGSPPNERYGVLVDATVTRTTGNVNIYDLEIFDVYPETDTPHEGRNPTTYVGIGIRLWGAEDIRSSSFKVEGCDFKRMGFKSVEMRRVNDIELLNNTMTDIGGPSLQASRCDNIVVRGNTVDGSGQYVDPRMHGRGSGIWTWTCNNVLIENNRFMRARGRNDSCGAHIDFNCNDVIIQYNLSVDNAGGFVEILGNNNNCAYRYNVSINDGHRLAGVDGADLNGQILWTSGFVGENNPRNGPFNSYIYNNTIYQKADQRAGFSFQSTTGGLYIANNIFFLEGPTAYDLGGPWIQGAVDRVVWENNLYQRADLLPANMPITDTAPLVGDPGFANLGGLEAEDYRPYRFENVKDKSVPIQNLPGDPVGLKVGFEVASDFFGNPIVGIPDLGAIETGDARPPLPEAASFDTVPAPLDDASVVMEGVRVFEPVEYYFEEVSGNAGGTDSGWQSDRTYIDSGLAPRTAYKYRVSLRDAQNQEIAPSGIEEVVTSVVDPFKDLLVFEEDFNPTSFLGNINVPFPPDAWYQIWRNPWQADSSGNLDSVFLVSGDTQLLRIGYGFDEVLVRHYIEETWSPNRDYRFTGDWEIRTVLDNSLGFIAGVGEFEPDTGELLQRIKEAVFGDLGSPAVGERGDFELNITSAELQAANVSADSYIGVFFHHDDDGVLFNEGDGATARSDVYLVDNLELWQLASDPDTDGDGMTDAFETAYGFNLSDPSDAAGDLDGDGLLNVSEFILGTLPNQESIAFLPPVSVEESGTRVEIPASELREGRIYLLERSEDLGETNPWRVVDSFAPGPDASGSSHVFDLQSADGVGFFRIRIEWAR